MPLALIALAIGGFGIGLTEFGIMGLLPEVAADFGVSETVAGYLISGYALSVAVGAIALTAALTKVDRKWALLGLMVLFIAGNLISAVAETYSLMMVGRIVAALCHGAFFGIGSVVASRVVAPEKQAGAIAIMFTGLTLATVLGVPLGTFLGQAAGWRSTFWAITAIGVVALIGIWALVPRSAASGVEDAARTGDAVRAGAAPSLRSELLAFRQGQVWVSIVVTILGFGGMFGAFAYIAFTLTEVSGFSAGAVPWLLGVFGGGMFVGSLLGGRAADRNIQRTLVVVLAVLTVVLVVFALTAGNKVATVASLLLMGGFGSATIPGLQMRIMQYAAGAPTMASGANIAAFNIGNAFGAWLAGLGLAWGLGYRSPLWVGAVVTLVGLVVLVVGGRVAGASGAGGAEGGAGGAGVGRSRDGGSEGDEAALAAVGGAGR